MNLGILAHVDAGKTTLTERLLYAAGVIDEIGSVDDGSTQTDSLALERLRGITIKSAVVSFAIDDLTVNLIDTPGHPDFIAEVERVLSVLDATILVISAVEGVQAQTRVLMRTLQRLRIPTVLFVNKIDRRGARYDGLVAEIAEKLTPAAIPMGTARGLGTRHATFVPHAADNAGFSAHLAELLTDHDDALLAAYVEERVSHRRLRKALAAQTGRALVHPVFFGSAINGAGTEALIAGVRELLPNAPIDVNGPVSGTVFKVERSPAGEKVAYVRMFSGLVRVRDSLRFGRSGEEKVTAVSVFEHGQAVSAPAVAAGQIGKLWGLADIQVGDQVGVARGTLGDHHFAPPTLETAVVPRHRTDKTALYVALTQLAEQDPLISLRQDDNRQELYVSLYGEVQKEVIEATLADDYGIGVDFRESTTLCIERPIGTGEAAELLQEDSNPFRATIGLRVEPAPHGSGIEFRLSVDPRTVPAHIYKNVGGFTEMMEQYVRQSLREGLFGWQVTDCVVTMIRCGYSVADGPPSVRGPDSTAADFRKLTPLVLMSALARARTHVCEPIHHFRLETPPDTLGAVLPAVARLRAVPETPEMRGPSCVLKGDIPAAALHGLRQQLAGLTRGEGVVESRFDRYQPIRGKVPTRPRTDNNPLDRKVYLTRVLYRR
nr:TetM/TetW/TetO/TetS family tetracycline resistance ribosomal protection protein [Phytoactinopolyspora mesophila]